MTIRTRIGRCNRSPGFFNAQATLCRRERLRPDDTDAAGHRSCPEFLSMMMIFGQ